MSSKKIIFILISFTIILISLQNTKQASEICQKITCRNFEDPSICIQTSGTTSYFQACPKDQYCSIETSDPVSPSSCTKNPLISFKRLPSLPCTEDKDCLSEKCDTSTKTCHAKKNGEICKEVNECDYGLTCRHETAGEIRTEKKCLPPFENGKNCDKDSDCKIDQGCMKGICTKYFSVNNDESTGGSDFGKDFNFCKSGYVSAEGICKNLTLDNPVTECSETLPCEYNEGFGKAYLSENCLCGYNPEGKKYCLLGSGNWNYTKYLDLLKEYHLNNENCHLSERNAEGCQKDLISGDEKILKKIKKLIHAKYWAKENNKLINAPECAFAVELPDYDRSIDQHQDPEPSPLKEGKCAKYSCEKKIFGNICAKSQFIDEYEINIKLADVCAEGVYCQIPGEDPNEYFYNGSSVNATCSKNNYKNNLNLKNMKYPGEKCEIDTDCAFPLGNPSSQFHKCIDGKCNGMEEGGICEDNS